MREASGYLSDYLLLDINQIKIENRNKRLSKPQGRGQEGEYGKRTKESDRSMDLLRKDSRRVKVRGKETNRYISRRQS